MDIMMGLSAIKQTLDITKDLREIDDKISVADLKLRLSDIVERLLEAREALYDAKERERELLEEIARLEALLNKPVGCVLARTGFSSRVGIMRASTHPTCHVTQHPLLINPIAPTETTPVTA